MPFRSSPTDSRKIKLIELDNQMKVLLMSNHRVTNNPNQFDTDASGASIAVKIGSNQDPSIAPGLAHFLEHMLLRTSKKYPNDDFHSITKKCGGTSNATTKSDITTYYFSCETRSFRYVLDVFANYFIKPTFDKSAMEREILAIDSEFQMKFGTYRWQILSILRTMSVPDHPFEHFGMGNLESLKYDPEAEGIEIHKLCQHFYKRFYSSHLMTLVIECFEPLDTMENYVRTLFTKVPLVKTQFNDINIDEFIPAIDHDKFHKYYYTSHNNSLSLHWTIPNIRHMYKLLPEKILNLILGDFGEGSMQHVLKSMGLIERLHTRITSVYSPYFSYITIVFTCTDEGFEKINTILEVAFDYINVLKQGFSPEFTNYILDWNYIAMHSPILNAENKFSLAHYCSEISCNMHYYNVDDCLVAGKFVLGDDEKAIINILEQLSPDDVCIMQGTNHLDYLTEETEYDNVKYGYRDFTEEELKSCFEPSPIEGLSFPKNNPLFPSTFETIPMGTVNNDVTKSIIADYYLLSNYGQLFYLPIRIHKADIRLIFTGDCLRLNVDEMMMYEIWLEAINDKLDTTKKYGLELGLNFEINDVGDALMINISGFTGAMKYFIFLIMKEINELDVSHTEFNKYVKIHKKRLNVDIMNDQNLVQSIAAKLKAECAYTIFELYEAAESIDYDTFVDFAIRLFNDLELDTVFSGNLTEDFAVELFEDIVKGLKLTEYGKSGKRLMRFFKNKITHIRTPSYNTNTKSTHILVEYFAGLATVEAQACIGLLQLCFDTYSFNYLRTKEQLGYTVASNFKVEYDVAICSINVIGDGYKHSVDHVRSKIEYMFQTLYLEYLKNLSDNDFEKIKSIFQSKYAIFLSRQPSVFVNAILRRDFSFDNQEAVLTAASSISKQQLMDYFESDFLRSEDVRQLIVEIDSHDKAQNPRSNLDPLVMEYLPIDSKGTMSDKIEDVIDGCPFYS